MEWIDALSQAVSAVNQGNIVALVALFFIVALTEMGVPFPQSNSLLDLQRFSIVNCSPTKEFQNKQKSQRK